MTATVAAALGLAVAACGGTSPSSSTTTTERPAPVTSAPPTTTVPTTVGVTTTTTFSPTAPQPSAAAAAAALVTDWGRQDRAGAESVASPAAVAALFAVTGRALQFRGCSDQSLPITCTYADRSSATGVLYEVNADPAPGGGWYVTSVQIE